MAASPAIRLVTGLARRLPAAWIERARVQRLLKAAARIHPAGPTDAERRTGSVHVWGEARAAGRRVTSRLRLPEGYTFTAQAAIEIAQRVLRGAFTPGYQTPSCAYGADLILALDGCTRSDEP